MTQTRPRASGPGRPRVVLNALPLEREGGGVGTYIRELLGAMVVQSTADLVAAVQSTAAGLLPPCTFTPGRLHHSVGVLPTPVSRESAIAACRARRQPGSS